MTDTSDLNTAAPLDDIDLATLLAPVARRWRQMIAAGFLGGVLGYGGSFLMTPVYAGITTFLPPQQQQSSASAALASLGALGALAGGAAGVRSPAEQFVSLMQSNNAVDRIIGKFKLKEAYKLKFQDATRRKLAKSTSITVGKKDGIIAVEVFDPSPQRAADLANQYVVELQRMTGELALSEAQQRRVFFERQMQQAKTHLAVAQTDLQASGFTAGALNAEPRAAADAYARLRAQMAAEQIRLATLRSSLSDTAPQIVQQTATVDALAAQIAKLEKSDGAASASTPDYITKYREYKYQETLFELMARQYEVARVDESREGALVQVIDRAAPAEHREFPRRSRVALASAFAGGFLFALFTILRARARPRPLAGVSAA